MKRLEQTVLNKWKLFRYPFVLVLAFACILFGSAFQYSFSESQENEESSIPFLLCVIQELPNKEKHLPPSVQGKQLIVRVAGKVVVDSRIPLLTSASFDSRWIEVDKIRDPPGPSSL